MELGPGVQALLDRGDKVAAMSLVHEQTGMGLAEAKRTVEQMMGGS
jgi:ribosomal protein L7/L12